MKPLVLLVDDDPRNLDALEGILAPCDFGLLRAQSPQEGLLSLIQHDVACIVLDIRMPSMSGIEFARLIKTRKKSEHIPILFLTAYFQDERDVLTGYGAGAVDYLTKPVAADVLRSKVTVFVDLYRKTRELAELNATLEAEVAQRRKAEEGLRVANEQLALRVEERTADLSRTASKLQLTEMRYREVVFGLSVAVYVCDHDGRIALFNQAAAQLWGREPLPTDQWCGSHRLLSAEEAVLAPEEYPMALTLRGEAGRHGQEMIVERMDGSRRIVLPYPVVIREAHGTAIGGVNTLVDITERKKIEEASRQLAAIVESSDDAIISMDIDGIIRTWNQAAERHLGYSAEEAIGRPGSLLVPPEGQEEQRQMLAKILTETPTHHYETLRRRKDGSTVNVSLTISPIKDERGRIIGTSKILRDITDRRRAQLELEAAHAAAIAAGRAKDAFLAVLSHELRTPLNPVLLVASDASENPSIEPEVRADFEMILRHVELEARLIDDLLDLTRLSHGKITLRRAAQDLHDILRDATNTLVSEINQKQLHLRLRLEERPAIMWADDVRLRQIFWNILRNSIKFTPKGGTISVKTTLLEEKHRVVVTIVDSGIGIAPGEVDRVFDAFAQADHSQEGDAHQYGGIGLGLTIAKMLTELHAGSIAAFSAGKDCGSEFRIEFPLAEAADTAAEKVRSGADRPTTRDATIRQTGHPHILLVEDHEATRLALTRLLSRRGFQVTSAGTIAEARLLADRESFSLVISDLGLPDGNGCDLMSHLKSAHRLQGIALTGYGMEHDIARAVSAGFTGHLTKPVRIQELQLLMIRVLSGIQSAGE